MATKKTSSRDLLRRYINGTITAPEEAELERLARNDEVLADALRGLQSAPEEDHAARVQNMVGAARKKGRSSGATVIRQRPNRFRWAAAAAILLLVTSSLVLLPRWLDQGADAMAMENKTVATPPPLAPAESPAGVAANEQPTATQAEPEATVAPKQVETKPLVKTTSPPKVEKDNNPAVGASAAPSDVVEAAPEPARPSPIEEVEKLMEEEAIPDPEIITSPPPSPTPTIANRDISVPSSNSPARAKRKAEMPAVKQTGSAGGAGNVGSFLDGRITTENGYPIINALVRLPGLPLGERTDSNGLFQLPADATTTALVITHPDYETENVEVSTFTEKLQISLERKPFEPEDNRPRWIQDGANSRIIFDNRPGYASPLEGYNALRKRIEANRPAEVPKGKVKLSFLVNPDGTLSDFQFKGRPSKATMDYIGETLIKTSVWEIMRGEEPVRVYFKLVF